MPCSSTLPTRSAGSVVGRLKVRAFALAALLASIFFLAGTNAFGKQNGIAAQGCTGCHRGGKATTATLDAGVLSAPLGGTITLTLTIPATNGPAAGMYLRSNNKGTLSVIAGEGTKLEGGGVMHSTPKRGTGDSTTFRVGWTAPTTPGGVTFDAWVLSANGDGSSNGDGDGHAYLALTYGCPGNNYYNDGDNDGYGSMVFPAIRDCAKPQFFSDNNTDCNDYNEKIYPGAPEICNGKDDNCNGMIDEGLPIGKYYEDNDGDGHGAGMNFILACGVSKGYGAGNDDCNDNDPTIYPGAPELCNFRDDNCNGKVDEGARTYCGTGWCLRAADGCGDSVLCTPGKPRAEECNAFDDDCDGVIDNGPNLCDGGKVCVEGYCVPPGSKPPGTTTDPDGGIVASPSPAPHIGEGGGCDVGEHAPWAAAVAGFGWLAVMLLSRRRAHCAASPPREG